MINGAHGDACTICAAIHSAFGKPEIRLGLDGVAVSRTVDVGVELLYDYEAVDEDSQVICACNGLGGRRHYLCRDRNHQLRFLA